MRDVRGSQTPTYLRERGDKRSLHVRVLVRFRAEYKIRKRRRWLERAVTFHPSKTLGWLKAVRACLNLKFRKGPAYDEVFSKTLLVNTSTTVPLKAITRLEQLRALRAAGSATDWTTDSAARLRFAQRLAWNTAPFPFWWDWWQVEKTYNCVRVRRQQFALDDPFAFLSPAIPLDVTVQDEGRGYEEPEWGTWEPPEALGGPSTGHLVFTGSSPDTIPECARMGCCALVHARKFTLDLGELGGSESALIRQWNRDYQRGDGYFAFEAGEDLYGDEPPDEYPMVPHGYEPGVYWQQLGGEESGGEEASVHSEEDFVARPSAALLPEVDEAAVMQSRYFTHTLGGPRKK